MTSEILQPGNLPPASAAREVDTSGSIDFGPHPEIELPAPLTFTRYAEFDLLNDFQQGYVEAMLRSMGEAVVRHSQIDERDEYDHARFSHLAPETLARIMADCERFSGLTCTPANKLTAEHGERFWRNRQTGMFGGFPLLTPYLGDDGLLYLREGM